MIRANFIHTLRTTLCVALSLGLVACTGIDKDTIGDSESEGDTTSESATGSTSGGESSTGGDSGSDTDVGGDTEGNTSTTGATTGEDPTTTGEVSTTGTTGSTGGEGDDIVESCEDACEVVYVCLAGEYESMEECVADCIAETTPEEPSAECEAAVIDFNSCVAVASCEDFESDTFCETELDLMIEVCDVGGEECTVGIGGDAESCGIVQDCGEGSMELDCAGDSCRCLLDDEEVGSCTNDVCVDELDPNALYVKALTCCGFEF